jgi:hypothetical protein
MEQVWLVNIFFGIAVICLAVVTIGVGYLTITDWQEKRAIQEASQGQSRKNKG